MKTPQQIRFDDIEALKGLISEDFGPFGQPFQLCQKMVDDFAELTGDKQWIHSDVERAKSESPFGTTIAHGFLLVSLINVLDDVPLFDVVGHQSIINYGADRLRFVRPVPANAQIRRRSRLVHVRKKGPNGTQLTVDIEIWADAEGPAVCYRAIVLFL